MRVAFCIAIVLLISCGKPAEIPIWTTFEVSLSARSDYDNPYMHVALTGVFTNQAGDSLIRPGFWDGGDTWKVRFSPPMTGEWSWSTYSQPHDPGLSKSGTLMATSYQGTNALISNGLLKMSPGKRSVVHQSGKSFLVVGDTPWAIPFRATTDQVRTYARDRQTKGFNSALLMSLQPDMKATGPNKRNTELGFAIAFSDLSSGHITSMDPGYFQYLDSLVAILIEHEIVPVFQPVFHGFGWKGLDVLGNYIDPDEYVRYSKYLLARYGHQPAMWLLAGDNGGRDPGVKEAGEMLEMWDCYQQPTGLHYNPCDDYVAVWAENNPLKHCMHYNKTYQDEDWLDFQWAQTGHNGEHLYHKVSRMYDNIPVKAAANGEPTYEGMMDGQNGLGWWQGEEAWMQLMSGGTMGVVYGAASLWQWKITASEEGWGPWAAQPKSWKEAMAMPGSDYVGQVGKILESVNMTDIKKRWDLAGGQPLLAREGKTYVAYLNEGGVISISGLPAGKTYQWINPKTGEVALEGLVSSMAFSAPDEEPWVLVIN